MKAILKNYRQSPRKVRLVADLIRGKSVREAKNLLAFLPKKSSPAVEKLLDSAIANARSHGATMEQLFVSKISVDKGAVIRRYRPFARGRAGSIRKTMSIVHLELAKLDSAKLEKRSTQKSSRRSSSSQASSLQQSRV